MNCRLFLFFSSNAYTTVFTSSLRYRVTVITKAGKKKNVCFEATMTYGNLLRLLGEHSGKNENKRATTKKASNPANLTTYGITILHLP